MIVQHTNFLTSSAKVNEVEEHGLVWATFWVDFDDIEKRVNNVKKEVV
jgi:hypothetical protein